MNRKKIFIALCFIGGVLLHLSAQNLDRVALSSGGMAGNTLNATIGEVIVFSFNGNGINFNAGSQSDQNNTGGLVFNAAKTNNLQQEILIYPNPVEEILHLQIQGLNSESAVFHIYDINGKLVLLFNMNGNNNNYALRVGQLLPGNYLIQGASPSGETTGKIQFVKL